MDSVFSFSLFEALAHRRVRRFGRGYEFTRETFKYRSDKEPVPLDQLETAVLAWAASGINGLALGEGQITTGVHSSWNGRVYPSPCNDQRVALLMVNDDGVFVYEPPDAERLVEIAAVEDREKIVDWFREGIHQLDDRRPDFTEAAWISANDWMANKPGSTLFFPLVDLSMGYINNVLAAFEREGLRVRDERSGDWAGIGEWVESGTLEGPEVTLQWLDRHTLTGQIAPAHFMGQNIGLACEAIGLGFVITRSVAPVVLGGTPFTDGLGCRFTSDKAGDPNPVGLDGHLEGRCPPYFENMNDAVDDFLSVRYGSRGILLPEYPGQTPLKEWQHVVSKGSRPSPEAIQATKDFCNYVYNAYGRFPATVDTIQLPVVVTAHHLDVEFYDQFYPPQAVSERIRQHMRFWHDM
jgi:hypothetical protein